MSYLEHFLSPRSISEPFTCKLQALMPSVDQLFVSRHVLRAAIEARLRCPTADSYYACVVSPTSCEYLEQNLAESQVEIPDELYFRLASLCAKLYARWAINKHAEKLAKMKPTYRER